MPANSISRLSSDEQRRIYAVQQNLGVPADKLAHVRETARYFHRLESRQLETFYYALNPANQAFEESEAYLSHVGWLADSTTPLSSDELRDLEAGVCLHDIGYAITPGGDHPEAGYQLLTSDTRSSSIWQELGLSPQISREHISLIARYHGFFSDVGYLYPVDMIGTFSDREKVFLLVMSALDSVVKPAKKGFHSMLFSRILQRYQQIMEEPQFSKETRLQHLFGPINYCWLHDDDFHALQTSIEREGLNKRRGFSMILANAYFWCWPLLKDIVTPKVEFAGSYFTPACSEHISHFARFLAVLSQVAEKLDQEQKIIFDTQENYFEMDRDPFLLKLRAILALPELEIKQEDEGTYLYRDHLGIQVNETGCSIFLRS